jgi:hypothetical protein
MFPCGIAFALTTYRTTVCGGLTQEYTMRSDEKLDLCGILKPCCLLQCKSVLASMKPGSVLEVRIGDPETYTAKGGQRHELALSLGGVL